MSLTSLRHHDRCWIRHWRICATGPFLDVGSPSIFVSFLLILSQLWQQPSERRMAWFARTWYHPCCRSVHLATEDGGAYLNSRNCSSLTCMLGANPIQKGLDEERYSAVLDYHQTILGPPCGSFNHLARLSSRQLVSLLIVQPGSSTTLSRTPSACTQPPSSAVLSLLAPALPSTLAGMS